MSKKNVFYVFVILFFISILLLGGCVYTNYSSFESNAHGFDSKQIDIDKIDNSENLISICKPAVVGISVLNGGYQSIGTGVCVQKGAYILTNNHVVEGGGYINLYLSNGSKTSAKIVWTDASSDLAMLKANADIPYLPLAKADSYSSGDEVFAIGTPIDLAFKHSATKGIISAVNRTISVDNDYGQSTLYNLIQHDASINPGNSGGPLINLKGEVVGINTVKVTDAEGMGFAIPVDTFRPVIEKISANGGYETTYMGVFGYDNQLKSVGNIASGFYIQDVAKNSVADIVGLKKGDVILQIDDKKITLAKDLKIALYEHNVGDKIKVVAKTKDGVKTFVVTLEKHPCSFCSANKD